MNTEKTLQINSTSSEQTEQLGEQVGSILKPTQVIELVADLGGGKTTFVKGLAKGLGYKGSVSSPTFTLSREYSIKNSLKIYHYDFYRLSSAGIMETELQESIAEGNSINIIEWADAVKDVLPKNRLTITLNFNPNQDNERFIDFSGESILIEDIKKATAS